MKKQETLEEAISRIKSENEHYIDEEAFELGAKWQQERMYNQIKELHDNENITGFSKRAYAQCLDIVENLKRNR